MAFFDASPWASISPNGLVRSPLIGLYFALYPDGHNLSTADSEGALWCLLPTKLNELVNVPDPTVVPMFSDDAKPQYSSDTVADLYKPARLHSGVSEEASPLAGISIRTTRRIRAQHGVFTVHHLSPSPIEDLGAGQHIWRYIIPREKRQSLADELRHLRINALSVFPELDNVAAQAEEAVRAALPDVSA